MKDILEKVSLKVRFINKLKNLNNQNHKVPWRKLYDFEILFVTNGEIVVKTKTETYTVRKNQLHIMPPNKYHTRFFNEGTTCDYYNAHLDFFSLPESEDFSVDETYRKQAVDKNYKTPTKLKKRGMFENIAVPNLIDIKDSKTFTDTFEKLYETYEGDDQFKKILIKQYFYRLLYLILNECENNNIEFFSYKKNPHLNTVNRFVDYVNQNYSKKIDLDEFAHKYGLSKNYFAKIFKEQFNIAPHEFIINKRLEEGKRLLMKGKYSISEIATEIGYEDSAYFSRLFKKKEGVSPLHYLQNKK